MNNFAFATVVSCLPPLHPVAYDDNVAIHEWVGDIKCHRSS